MPLARSSRLKAAEDASLDTSSSEANKRCLWAHGPHALTVTFLRPEGGVGSFVLHRHLVAAPTSFPFVRVGAGSEQRYERVKPEPGVFAIVVEYDTDRALVAVNELVPRLVQRVTVMVHLDVEGAIVGDVL